MRRYRGPESPPNLWNDDDGARDASILGRPVRLSHLVEGNAREDINLHVAVGNRTEEIGSVLAERLRIGVVGEDRGTGEIQTAVLLRSSGSTAGAGPEAAP